MTIHRINSPELVAEAELQLAKQDPRMATLIERFGTCGLKPWGQDLLTALITSIISQQLSVKAAATISGRVKDLMPNPDVIDPKILASLSVETLRGCGLSAAKTRYSQGLAQAVCDSELNLDELQNIEDEKVIEALIKFPGIGRWTAEMFLIFALGAADVLATDDLGLKRGMKYLLAQDDYPTEEQFVTEARSWQPYRSVASWYLWRLAE